MSKGTSLNLPGPKPSVKKNKMKNEYPNQVGEYIIMHISKTSKTRKNRLKHYNYTGLCGGLVKTSMGQNPKGKRLKEEKEYPN